MQPRIKVTDKLIPFPLSRAQSLVDWYLSKLSNGPMSEHSRREGSQHQRQPEEFGKSRDQLNQPKGIFEDLFRISESNREPSRPSNTENPTVSNDSGQATPSRPKESSDE